MAYSRHPLSGQQVLEELVAQRVAQVRLNFSYFLFALLAEIVIGLFLMNEIRSTNSSVVSCIFITEGRWQSGEGK